MLLRIGNYNGKARQKKGKSKMKVYKRESKNGQRVLAMASGFLGRTLDDVYTNYSCRKQQAYNYCLKKFHETPNGSNFHITSCNSNFFTVAWCGDYEDPKTGEPTPAKFVETYANSYVVI